VVSLFSFNLLQLKHALAKAYVQPTPSPVIVITCKWLTAVADAA